MGYTNKEKNNEWARGWYHRNKSKRNTPERKERQKELSKLWRKNNPLKKYLSGIKGRANRLDLEFNLTVDDIVFPEVCPILQIPLVITEGYQKNETPAADRVDNSKGYTRENTRFISHKANRMKSNMSLEDIERLYLYSKGEI